MNARLLIAILALGGMIVPSALAQDKGTSGPNATAEKDPRKEKAAPSGGGPIDLNTASEKDLDSLPGVGPVTAKKIIDHRPYRSIDDLAKAGVAPKEVDKLRPLVTVGAANNSPLNSPPSAKNTRHGRKSRTLDAGLRHDGPAAGIGDGVGKYRDEGISP